MAVRYRIRTCQQCGISKRLRPSQPFCSKRCFGLSRRMDPDERFWTKVDKSGPIPIYRPDLGPCWLWTAGVSNLGYAYFKDAEEEKAHRWAYVRIVGPIPPNRELDHLCRVRHCVRPTHMEVVTHAVNVLRGSGPTAINAAKTHCVHGHLFDETNTAHRPEGARGCKTCSRRRAREQRLRQSMSLTKTMPRVRRSRHIERS